MNYIWSLFFIFVIGRSEVIICRKRMPHSNLTQIQLEKLVFLQPFSQACLHAKVFFPAKRLHQISLKPNIILVHNHIFFHVKETNCTYIERTKSLDPTNDSLDFVGCTDITNNVLSKDQIDILAEFEIILSYKKSQHESGFSLHLPTCESHGIAKRQTFDEIQYYVTPPICSNSKINDHCKQCQQTCLDFIQNPNRFLCDQKWVTFDDIIELFNSSNHMNTNLLNQTVQESYTINNNSNDKSSSEVIYFVELQNSEQKIVQSYVNTIIACVCVYFLI